MAKAVATPRKRKPTEAGSLPTGIQLEIGKALERREKTPYWLGQQMKLSGHSIYKMLSGTTNVKNIQKMFDILGLKVFDPKK